MKNYAELLKSHDLKSTIQRLAILKLVEEFGHIGVDEIYANLTKTYPSISLNTVYLNVQTLCEKGILIEIPIQNAKSKYEIAKDDHFHFICRKCGTVSDEENQASTLHSIFAEVSGKNEFEMDSSTVNIYGICKHCSS